ncbi:MAG: hypothetical protein H0T65_01595 [Deltaproteobacteria bacterium]|nr:hypothetical protein [Deltaproteobacteria bacterium]
MRTALLFLVVAGCTHQKNITEAHELVGDEVVLEGQYGHQVTAVGVNTPAGVTFYDKANGGMVPSHEIVKIKDVSHGRGAIEGLGIGGGIGIVTGAVIGLASGDDECGDDHGGCFLAFSAGEKAMILGVVLGGLGGLVGLVVGAAKGSTTVYEHPRSGVSVRVGGPAGSTAGLTMTF